MNDGGNKDSNLGTLCEGFAWPFKLRKTWVGRNKSHAQ